SANVEPNTFLALSLPRTSELEMGPQPRRRKPTPSVGLGEIARQPPCLIHRQHPGGVRVVMLGYSKEGRRPKPTNTIHREASIGCSIQAPLRPLGDSPHDSRIV